MKKIAFISLLVVVAFLGTSCDQGLFGTNFFSAFESYDLPNVETATVDDLVDAAEDDRFFDELSDEEVVIVTTTLETAYTDPGLPTEERADAALLAADVYINTSGADETLSNLNALISDAVAGTAPDFSDTSFISDFFSSSDPAVIEEQLLALDAAADALIAYGGLLGSEIDPAVVALDDNPGDTATKALVSGLTSALLTTNPVEDVAAAIASGDPAQFDALNPLPDTSGAADSEEALNILFGGADLVNVITAGIGMDDISF